MNCSYNRCKKLIYIRYDGVKRVVGVHKYKTIDTVLNEHLKKCYVYKKEQYNVYDSMLNIISDYNKKMKDYNYIIIVPKKMRPVISYTDLERIHKSGVLKIW